MESQIGKAKPELSKIDPIRKKGENKKRKQRRNSRIRSDMQVLRIIPITQTNRQNA